MEGRAFSREMINGFNTFVTKGTSAREPHTSFEKPITRSDRAGINTLNVIRIRGVTEVIILLKLAKLRVRTEFLIIRIEAGSSVNIDVLTPDIRKIFSTDSNFLGKLKIHRSLNFLQKVRGRGVEKVKGNVIFTVTDPAVWPFDPPKH